MEKAENSECPWGRGATETSTVSGNLYWKPFAVFTKTEHTHTLQSVSSALRQIPNRNAYLVLQKIFIKMFRVALFTVDL